MMQRERFIEMINGILESAKRVETAIERDSKTIRDLNRLIDNLETYKGELTEPLRMMEELPKEILLPLPSAWQYTMGEVIRLIDVVADKIETAQIELKHKEALLCPQR